MIDIKKQYRTKSGKEVKIYAINEDGPFPVHGAVKGSHWWEMETWTQEGRVDHYMEREDDLVEVPKRIQQTVYLNIYDDSYNNYVSVRYSKENALDKAEDELFACVKVDIDVEEGHGLT
jgi:hypothetical protein